MAPELPTGSHFNFGTAETLEMDRPGEGRGRGFRALLFLGLCLFGVLLDQGTKLFMRGYLADGPKPFIPGFMELRLVENKGVAFSMLPEYGRYFIYVAAAVAFVGFLWSVIPEYQPTGMVATLALVCAGGLGNMIDRIMKGTVTDFLATTLFSFPVFNVADILVVVGAIFFLILSLFSDK